MNLILRKQGLPVWLLFPTTFLLLIVFPSQAIAQCFDYDSLDMKNRRQVYCPLVTDFKSSLEKQEKLLTVANSTNMFELILNWDMNDDNTCKKVRNAFVTAGKIITTTLILTSPIIVKATFSDFCELEGECSSLNGYLTLGGAIPARSILIQDLDGKQRLYPQALVKQFGYNTHQEFKAYDIFAEFNSKINFWFDSDPNPIKATQIDFLSVIVHELMHGLGFFSGWSNYLGDETEALIPYPIYILKNGCSQFIEMAFDQYMIVIPQNRNVTSYTDILNKFSTNSCTGFSSLKSFRNAFEKSPQYETAKTMYKHSITKNSLGFLPRGKKDIKDALILETGLGTYQQGSSIGHVDYQTYTNSSDFLMRFMQDDCVSLQDAILAGGNYKGGAIGPKLKMVLETLGYATQDNPNPYRPPPSTPPPLNSFNVSSSAISYKLLEGSSFHWFKISFMLLGWFSSQILRL
ncbi:hypothetical protein G9A89_003963 [Geosiphon pyriformis]|nr:hypothetical protein G9A89_003963 [Geosiphon pyriformis]